MDISILKNLFAALEFAADKHRHQRRKGRGASPYINHPIEVAQILLTEGGVTEIDLLSAALLHDTLEDTATTPAELRERFGPVVCRLVEEMTDDQDLPKAERKRLQVERAAGTTVAAKQIKLADKIANVRDIEHDPPVHWSLDRQLAYLDWVEQTFVGLRGVNPGLDRALANSLEQVRAHLQPRCGGSTSPVESSLQSKPPGSA